MNKVDHDRSTQPAIGSTPASTGAVLFETNGSFGKIRFIPPAPVPAPDSAQLYAVCAAVIYRHRKRAASGRTHHNA